jgi:hypothetical protein
VPDRVRRRLLALAPIAFLVVLGLNVLRQAPQDTRLALPLPAHRTVREAQVEVRATDDDEVVHRMVRRFAERAAPDLLRQELSLLPGPYAVRVELRDGAGGVRRLRGRFRVPADGEIRVSLHEASRSRS